METESNLNGIEMPIVDRNAELEEYISMYSYDRGRFEGSLNEVELCAAYGYELAMSPTETIMPEGENELSWLHDEISQTENILTGAQQFDMLETDVFRSQDPHCSDDESLNLSCTVKLEPQLDERNCSYQSQDGSIYLNLDTVDKGEFLTDPSPPLDQSQLSFGCSQASQDMSAESLTKTTEFVQALTRRMTLSQKVKFYAWFNSGLSIAEAAEKSKIPDLIPPPIRHPNCKYSKRRLKRLSKLLPNVFLQRQFVYETYFAGVDPKKIMRSLLIELNSEDLISAFENQFMMEELAIEQKQRRSAANKTVTASVESSRGREANLESVDIKFKDPRGDRANLVSMDIMGSLDKTVTSTAESPRGVEVDVGSSEPGPSHAEDLGSTERPIMLENLALFPINTKTSLKEPCVPSKNKPGLNQEPRTNTRRHINDQEHITDRAGMLPVEVATELPKMSLTRLKKFYKWCNQGINPSEALAKAKMPGLIPHSVPHPNNRYTWEETKKMSDVLPKSQKKIFNAEVFYGGKEPEEVMKNLMSHNVCPNKRFNVDLVSSPPEMADGDSKTSSISPEQCSPQSKNNPILSPIPVTGPEDLHVAAGLPKMPLNQRKKYYKWCNQGISPSQALAKAKVRGLVPKCVPHPRNKYSWEEVKILAAGLPHNFKMIFHTEVFYGGKEPETVMKTLTDDVNLHHRFNSNLKLVSGQPDDLQPSAKLKNGPMLGPIKSTSQSECITKREAKYGTVAKIPGLVPDFSGPHPACKHSQDQLKKKSSTLPTESDGDRFLVHAYHGGKNPYELVKTMMANHSNPCDPKTNPKTTKTENHNELQKQSRWNMIINYLVARGLTQEEALSQVENPSNKLVKELEEFVEKAHLEEQEMLGIIGQDSQPASQDSSEIHPECKNVPQESSDHPSTFLDDRQLVNYYLLISNGFSRDDAMKKAKSNGLPMHHLYRQHHLKSQLDFHYVQKMSKLLPTRELAKKFVIETYYGGNDPDKTMKLLESSGSGNCSDKLSQTHRELASNPWYSPSLTTGAVKNSILPAEVASTTALEFNSYSYPGFIPQHQNHGYPPREAPAVHSAGISTATISHFAHPSTLIAQEIQPQPMNNTTKEYIKTSSHKSETQSWKDLSPLLPTNEPVLENRTPLVKNNMSGPSEVVQSHSKLTDSEVKCFIVPTNYPIEFLNEPQMDAIESNILEAILEMEEDDVKPCFKDSFRSNGRYGFICNGEFSVNWLRKYLIKYVPYESASLQLMVSEPTTVRANAVFPLCKADDDGKILKFIEKQNRGLNVSRWSVVHRWNSDENTIMDLYIDEDSAEVVRKGARISFKLGSAEIFIAKNGSISSQNGSHLTNALPSVELSTCLPLPSSSPIPSPPPPSLPTHLTDALSSVESSTFPPLPSSSPIPSPPPPPPPPHPTDALPSVDSSTCPPLPSYPPISSPQPPPPPPTEEPSVIDTSLKGLLFGSASKSSSNQNHAQHVSPYSREISSSPDGIHRKRSRRHRSSSEDQRRSASRSSSLDSIGRSIQKLPKKLCKRRRSSNVYSRSRDRRRSSSKSRDRICRKKRLKERRRRHASRSSIYSGGITSLYGKDQRSDKSKHPVRLTSPISSESDFSTNTCPPVDSRLERAGSCENTEYMDYLR